MNTARPHLSSYFLPSFQRLNRILFAAALALLVGACGTTGATTTGNGEVGVNAPETPWGGGVFSEPQTNVQFPEMLGDLNRVKIKGDAKTPVGVVIAYRGAPSTILDFFVYPAGGNGRLADGIDDPGVKATFGQSLAAVREMQRRGLYQNAVLTSKGPREIAGDLKVLRAHMEFARNGSEKLSALYVRGVGGYVFKIRITFNKSDKAVGLEHVKQMEGAIRRMLSAARRAGPLAMATVPVRDLPL